MSLIRDTLKSILDETELTEPAEIAAELKRRIPDERREQAYNELIRAYVTNAVASTRRGVPTQVLVGQSATPSAKVAGVRDWWTKFLAERVQINGTWKVVADCTVADIDELARFRREIAKRNAVHAQRFEQLADVMRAKGVKRVADLDKSTAREALKV